MTEQIRPEGSTLERTPGRAVKHGTAAPVTLRCPFYRDAIHLDDPIFLPAATTRLLKSVFRGYAIALDSLQRKHLRGD